jgi:hypothetical protein
MTKPTGQLSLVLSLLVFILIFNGCGKQNNSNQDIKKEKKEIILDVSQSIINWTAYKKNGKYSGTIKFLNGKFNLESGLPVSGNCSVDLNTFQIRDIKDSAESKRVIDFIKSDKFLNTPKYPIISVNIRSIVPLKYKNMPDVNTTVKGSILIKDSAVAVVVTAFTRYSTDSVVVNSKVALKSSQWNIPLSKINVDKDFKDNPFKDDFDLELYIVAK